MRTMGAGQDALRRYSARRKLGPGGAFPTNGLATDHFEPCSPNATAWPVAPEHRSQRERFRCVGARRSSIRGRGGEWPQHRTHPSRLDGFTAFLALCAQEARATMANARGIQDPQGAIAFGAPFLG